MILLSVLIPSLPERAAKLGELLSVLHKQDDPRLEVIVLTDNRRRTLGAKRNAMVRMAQGLYVAHIDDDDLVSPDYFATVDEHLHDVDVVAYDAGVSFNGGPEFRVTTRLGAPIEHPQNLGDNRYSDIVRPPWHWCCWRRDFAARFPFPEDRNWTEDWGFLSQALPAVKTWHKIDRILFHHRWSEAGTTSAVDV